MDKHYIPAIEEFCVGFKFELFIENTNGWIEFVFNEFSSLHNVYTFDGIKQFSIIDAFKKSNVRVKRLDFNDILELGWENRRSNTKIDYYDGNEIFTNAQMPLFPKGKYCNIQLIYNYELGTIHIHGAVNESFFQGYCKNKSELKKIMQQIALC